MSRLHDLHTQQDQSPWLDDLKRSYLQDGTLAGIVADGIRGVTSNPTIFAKAIEGEATYDEQFGELASHGSVIDAYWRLVMDDVTDACGLLRGTYDEAGGQDGFVSLEVAPDLARDTAGTIEAARWIHRTVDQPNLMVKIPATAEGVPAVEAMIADGSNINVTLIFSLDRYVAVTEAYIGGLEKLAAAGGDVSRVASVASFFISRVDTEIDRRLDTVGSPAALALRGKSAVANAKLAYELFERQFSGPRWDALAARGAHPQRPLWASTSTKNPTYPDLLYVDTLIGPHTVNTLPEATIAAFRDHGTVARTLDDDYAGAHAVIDGLAPVGVDMADVARVLEDELSPALTDKPNTLAAGPGGSGS